MEESDSIDLEEKVHLAERGIEELFFANNDELLREIEKKTGVYIAGRGDVLTLRGDERKLQSAKRIVENIVSLYRSGRKINRKEISLLIEKAKVNPRYSVINLHQYKIKIGSEGKIISPKSPGQVKYFKAIKSSDITFAIGPAGTGKTYLAMAFALSYLISENISRIILTRPVVEAGESLGYLPGDLEQKVNPYLRPLYDAIYDMIPYSLFQRYVERGAIEVAPLAYMRGRTLHDSFIILDEAQNTTKGQILMFLTRIGYNSKTIITGDITQVDLPKAKDSGLIIASRVLDGIQGISFIYLGPEDVIRHPLVEEIVRAFERSNNENKDV